MRRQISQNAILVNDRSCDEDTLRAGLEAHHTESWSWALACRHGDVAQAEEALHRRTQFRIGFAVGANDDLASDLMGWYSGENTTSSNRPQLVVVYLGNSSSLGGKP
jgi:hypothetical protein